MSDESNLVLFFGDTPFIRIIDALIDNIHIDHSKKEIQELAGISKASFFAHWPKVEKLNLVKPTRTFGNTTLFTLDTKNPFVKELLKLEAIMIEQTIPKEQKIPVRAAARKK
jgi:hypothetical protein